MSKPVFYGAIEAGGTKFVCGIGTDAGVLLESVRIDTRDPATTLAAVFDYFAAARQRRGPLRAVGVGSFGPVDLQRRSPTYGCITNTPKPGWAQFDLLGTLGRQLAVPMSIDTDVNVAALAEARWGACQQLQSLAYVTVGTGIGAGIVHDGRTVRGLIHPEMGHVMVRKHPGDHEFRGICPYHGDCLEGLACGPAIVARTGQTLECAAPTQPIWEIEADYLGQLAALLALSHSCERIVFGGGVMHNTALLGRLHERMLKWLGGYLPHTALAQPDYICAPALGDRAGVMGALALALGS